MTPRFRNERQAQAVTGWLTAAEFRTLERLCERMELSAAEVMWTLLTDVRADQLPRSLRQVQRAHEELMDA